MGQVQSDGAAAVDEGEQFSPATLSDAQVTPPPPSMESLIAGGNPLTGSNSIVSDRKVIELRSQHSMNVIGFTAYNPYMDFSMSDRCMCRCVSTEAASYGNNESESLDAKAQKALECPCIADLRNGQCGVQFSEAFFCYFKSTAEEKGSDCVHPFVTLQNCIKANPNAFSKGILEEAKVEEEEEPIQEYIRLPLWSRESKSSKSKL